jgi:hypothetical protein
LVTIEDVLEEIVGEIQDEYDREEKAIQKLSENVLVVDAAVGLRELPRSTTSFFRATEAMRRWRVSCLPGWALSPREARVLSMKDAVTRRLKWPAVASPRCEWKNSPWPVPQCGLPPIDLERPSQPL